MNRNISLSGHWREEAEEETQDLEFIKMREAFFRDIGV